MQLLIFMYPKIFQRDEIQGTNCDSPLHFIVIIHPNEYAFFRSQPIEYM